MNAVVAVVAILASFGGTVAAVTCVILMLVTKSLPHILPVVVTGLALIAAASSAWLGYWLWASGEALLVVFGVTVLVLAARLRKLRSQIEESEGGRHGR